MNAFPHRSVRCFKEAKIGHFIRLFSVRQYSVNYFYWSQLKEEIGNGVEYVGGIYGKNSIKCHMVR